MPARRYVGWAAGTGSPCLGGHCQGCPSPPPGAVHRLNGKVSGSLRVGQASVGFQDVDLHAYIVGSDGRAYTAISGVPQPAARALLPLLPVGGLFAWLFALEEPGSENGFSITGELSGGLGGAIAARGVGDQGFRAALGFLQSLSQLVLTSRCDPPREGCFGGVPTNGDRSLLLPRC